MWRDYLTSTIKRILSIGGLGLLLISCTDRIESTLPPVPTPLPHTQAEIPGHLKPLFASHCAGCHGPQGESGSAGSIYHARSRSPKNWVAFLKDPQSIDPTSKKPPVTDLSEAEYTLFGEWLARITKDNRPARPADK